MSHGESNPEPLSSRPWVSKGRSIRLMRHGAGLSTPARWFGRYMPRQVTGTRRTMVATDYWERGLTYRAYSLNPHSAYREARNPPQILGRHPFSGSVCLSEPLGKLNNITTGLPACAVCTASLPVPAVAGPWGTNQRGYKPPTSALRFISTRTNAGRLEKGRASKLPLSFP